MNSNVQNEKGLGLGISIMAILAILMLAPLSFGFKLGPFREGYSAILTGVYLQFWGTLFFLSYYFSHKTFFFRGLIWLCENFSNLRGRKMAFFYFALLFGLGTTALLHGIGSLSRDRGQEPPQSIPPRVESMENWWLRDPLLYIVLTIIIAGIYYRYRTRRNGSKR
jgi:hypothetical protein